MPDISYKIDAPLSVDQFRAVLNASTLGERRPVDDRNCLQQMIDHGNLTITAWDNEKLVGVARSVTDFGYCCYLSDLAVDTAYQMLGIGKKLIELTQQQLGPKCTLILLSAPAAIEYYPRIGMTNHPHAFVLRPGQTLK
jgi:ribosomal protein S18 acetylase RimI-like enzyme